MPQNIRQINTADLVAEVNRRRAQEIQSKTYNALDVTNQEVIRRVVTTVVGKHFFIDAGLILGRSRQAHVVKARNACCAILRNRYNLSFPVIGDIMLRVHGSVIHAIKKHVESRNDNSPSNVNYNSSYNRICTELPADLHELKDADPDLVEYSLRRMEFRLQEHALGQFTYNPGSLHELSNTEHIREVAESLQLSLSVKLSNHCLPESDLEVIDFYTIKLVQNRGGWNIEIHSPLKTIKTSKTMLFLRDQIQQTINEITE